MRSFKNILYFLAILYLVFNILLVFLLESIFQGLVEGNFLMLIPYWLFWSWQRCLFSVVQEAEAIMQQGMQLMPNQHSKVEGTKEAMPDPVARWLVRI